MNIFDTIIEFIKTDKTQLKLFIKFNELTTKNFNQVFALVN